jgi:TRAP-type C4-dicarboxylate transport system permease small subunit
MMNRWERMDEIFDRMEQTLLVILLSFMIFIAFLQIVLRNFFATGLTWGDPLVRNLVLWIGFLGAALATREGKHINIDVISKWVPQFGKTLVDGILPLFSFVICGLLTFAAFKFIENEIQMRSVTFGGVPSWIPKIILPITFGIMTFRFGLQSFKNLSSFVKASMIHGREGTS